MLKIKTLSHLKTGLLLIAIAAFMMACDSDSDSNDDIVPQTQSNEKMNGGWKGNYGADNTSVVFLMKDGDIYVQNGKGSLFFGTYTYTQPNNAFKATFNNANVELEINGTATEHEKITATFTASDDQAGDIELVFSDVSTRTSSFERLEGQWVGESSNYSIDADGGLSGTFMTECKISGTFSIIDTQFNLYILDTDLTECADARQFDGLAIISDKNGGTNNWLFGIARSDDRQKLLSIAAEKQ